MDKVIVNNQIVLMRKYVKQAKTHVINKFVKQVKSLEVKKGNDAQITKNKRKTERLIEKVKILKKIKVDFVSKSALSKSKDWKSLIEQKDASLEDQCLALLADFSSVQKEVEKFYSNHSILADKIPSLLIEWEMKNQNSNKKTKKGANKKKLPAKEHSSFQNNIKIAKKANENLESKEVISDSKIEHVSAVELESNLNALDKEKEESTEANSSENVCEDVETQSENVKGGLNYISSNKYAKILNQRERDKFKMKQSSDAVFPSSTKSMKDKLSVSHLKTDSDNQINFDQPDTETVNAQSNQSSIFQKLTAIANSNFELPNPKQKAFSSTNYQQTKSIAFLDLDKIKDLNEIPVETPILEDETEHLTKPKKDSFFLTSDGNSDDDSEKGDSNGSNSNFKRQDMSKRSSFNRRNFSHSNEIYLRKKGLGKPPNQNRNSWISDSKKFERSKNHKTNKSIIKHETSKRNNFSSYQNGVKENPIKKNQLKHPSPLKEKSTGPLHPSWEAKRKLKECAKTGFKGKRILFDE